jgi:hypothetical protein
MYLLLWAVHPRATSSIRENIIYSRFFFEAKSQIDFSFFKVAAWRGVNFRLNFTDLLVDLTVLKTIMFSGTWSGITHNFLKCCIPIIGN